MSKGFLVVFGAVAGLAFGAADYMQQRTQAGGSLSPTEYVGSILDRRAEVAEAKAAAAALEERRAVAPRDHLAAAVEGWERHGWSAELYERITGPKAEPTELEQEMMDKIKAHPVGGFLMSADAAQADRRAEMSYIYTRGDEVVMISATFKEPDPKGRTGAIMAYAAANMASLTEQSGFAVIKGVTFLQISNVMQQTETQSGAFERRHIVGTLGNRVEIKVDSRATRESVRELLGAIDYDAFNQMLDDPLPGIGSEAPVLSEAQEDFVLEATLAALKMAKAGKRKAAERKMLEALEPTKAERAIIGLAGGAAQGLTTAAPKGKQARAEVEAAPKETGAQVQEARVTDDEAQDEPPQIKINRPTKRKAGSSCGGGNFCRAGE